MGNLLLTNYCNRACTYCFAKTRVTLEGDTGRPGSRQALSAEGIEKTLRFLDRSGADTIGLLGGEPTLHPDFPEVIDRVLAAGLRIKLFSNGLMPAAALERIARAEPGEILTIINLNHPDETGSAELSAVEVTLRTLGLRAALGFNIHTADFDAGFLIDHVKRYALDPHIRLGLAQPVFGGDNVFVPLEDYPEVGRRIAGLAAAAGPKGLFIGLDCGFTLCMFDLPALGRLIDDGVGFKMLCNPIVDIGVDLAIWSCFPLSAWHPSHLDCFENRAQIVRFYDNKLRPFRAVGVMTACPDCRHKRAGNCSGGCVAHTLQAFGQDQIMKAEMAVRRSSRLRG